MQIKAIFSVLLLQLPLNAETPVVAESSPVTATASVVAPDFDYARSVLRVNSTIQGWSLTQPWEKADAFKRSAIGVLVGPGQILTTAQMASDAVSITLEDVRGIESVTAEVAFVDPGVNLALLKLKDPQQQSFVENLEPVSVVEPLEIGSTLKIVQMEDNGMALVSPGQIQGVDIKSTFAPGESQLCYIVKASLQSASSSYSIPAFKDEKLVGLLSSYDSEDQLSVFLTPEVTTAFLEDAADGNYQGFPLLGIAARTLTDRNFRDFLQLPSEVSGGIYITRVRRGSSAEAAGLLEGDVITKVAGRELDYRGFYDDERYGRLFWTNIIKSKVPIGSELQLSALRDGKPLEITANLGTRSSMRNLVPRHLIGRAPNFVVKGGMIFQELSQPFLENYGKDWRNNAPLDLLAILENPDDVPEDKQSIVILTATIPTQVTIGYENVRSKIVEEVNGVQINHIGDLDRAFQSQVETHVIKLSGKPSTLYLDAKGAAAIDEQLLQRGLPSLKRIEASKSEGPDDTASSQDLSDEARTQENGEDSSSE